MEHCVVLCLNSAHGFGVPRQQKPNIVDGCRYGVVACEYEGFQLALRTLSKDSIKLACVIISQVVL